jgi:DNA-binding NarL/FixJ family response regulator
MESSTARGARYRHPIGIRNERYPASGYPNHASESSARDGRRTRLALVDERSLTRASISLLLRTTGPEFAISSFSSVTDLLSSCANRSNEFGLILLSIGAAKLSEHRVQERIEQLRQALADVPVVILSDCDDTACIREAFRYGVRGYLPTTLEPPVVLEGLRLVRAGGTFVPADLVLIDVGNPLSVAKENRLDSTKPATLEGLTPRQREVFEWLRQGKSNKVIAFELQMPENTVKIHVRHILQRLKASNRTHAAAVASRTR